MIWIQSPPDSIVDYDTNPIPSRDFNVLSFSFQLKSIDFDVILIKSKAKVDIKIERVD